MGLDSRYITSVDLNPYLVDKDTGAPLSGGTIEFYSDDNRTSPKLVYELSGAPPNYTYTALPNPIQLSATGTIMDAQGNNIALYYFPYSSMDTESPIELYYVVVKNAFGVVQFTREAWPNIAALPLPGESMGFVDNALSNSQFVDVFFDPTTPFVLSYSTTGSNDVFIGPDWKLSYAWTGTGSITITRTSVAGLSDYPNNPPYILTITPGANLRSLTLSQRLYHNPSIFSSDANDTNGYLSGSVLLDGSSTIQMIYHPSAGSIGSIVTILNAVNSTGTYQQYNNTVLIPSGDNPNTADSGYIDIILNFSLNQATSISNIQLVGLNANIQNVPYEQTPVNRQQDQLFHYYNPLLQYKPIPSYLIGWNFAQNPAQFLGPTVSASSAGANTSRYVWDQTIIYQSVNSGYTVSRDGSGGMTITAGSTPVQVALIQYLPPTIATQVLLTNLSMNISGSSSQDTLGGTLSLWVTTAALPSVNSNNSIVATLDSSGFPATFNGTWNQVARGNLPNASFTFVPLSGNHPPNYGFTGWTPDVSFISLGSVTAVAVVVGFKAIDANATVTINTVSLVPGDIATPPAPQAFTQTVLDCQRFYCKSFSRATVPAQNVGTNTNEYIFPATRGASVSSNSNQVAFPTEMIAAPTITLYSPGDASAQLYNETHAGAFTGSSTLNINTKGFVGYGTGTGSTAVGDLIGFHWTADSRIGL